MDFGDLFEKGNWKLCRWIGVFFVGLPAVFFFSGGFAREVDGHGVIFSGGWFREIFIVILGLMGLIGLILLLASFAWSPSEDEES